MKADFKFINSPKELITSTIEFNNKPEFWKAVLASSPKYFVHSINMGKHIFGLSKFCAFKDIAVEEYLTTYRFLTQGGTTQKHIAEITDSHWIPFIKIDDEIKHLFKKWILDFFPNYNINNASFITINTTEKLKNIRSKLVTPEELEKRLALQKKIGGVGEEVAMKFEIDRLRIEGVKNPKKYIEQVSKRNSAAGYDIYSSTIKETRYIEVKSSLNKNKDFFITENEYQNLKYFSEEAYLYLVHITDLAKKEGEVIQILCNPIKYFEENNSLKPVAYKGSIE